MATFDDIIYNVMPMLVNGEQPTDESILQMLTKIAHQVDNKYWILGRADGQIEMQFKPIITPQSIPTLHPLKATLSHDEVIYRLSKLWLSTGKPVHIGKKEQASKVNNEKLSDLSLQSVPMPSGSNDFAKSKIENIDLLWLNEQLSYLYAFEIEMNTPITTAIDRFMELLKVEPEMSQRIVIVTPKKRGKKLDDILKKSHYIGHPLYMENKLVYLYAESLVEIYNLFSKRKPDYVEMMKYLDKYVVKATKA